MGAGRFAAETFEMKNGGKIEENGSNQRRLFRLPQPI